MKQHALTIDDILNLYTKLIYTKTIEILKDEMLAEEAFQDVLHEIINRLPQLTEMEEKSRAAYIRKIAYSKAVNIYRKEKKHMDNAVQIDDDEYLDIVVVSDFNINEEIAELRFDSYVAEYVEKMSPADNEILYMAFYEDMPYSAIARELGISEQTVRKRVSRAKERLKKLLEKDERSKRYFKQG